MNASSNSKDNAATTSTFLRLEGLRAGWILPDLLRLPGNSTFDIPARRMNPSFRSHPLCLLRLCAVLPLLFLCWTLGLAKAADHDIWKGLDGTDFGWKPQPTQQLPTPEEFKADPEKYIAELKSDLNNGVLSKVAGFAPRLLDIKPADSDLRAIYAIYCAATGQSLSAKEQLAQLRDARKKSALSLCAEAMILRLDGQSQEALAACQQAIKLNPRHPYPWNIMGRVYMNTGATTNALSCFQKAVELVPGFLPGHENLGAVNLIMGRFDQALSHFQKAIELNPEDSRALYGMALAYEAQGGQAQAMEALHKALQHQPKDPLALQKLGDLQLQLGMYEDASQTANRLFALNRPVAVLLLADAALHKGDTQSATDYLTKVKLADPQWHYLFGCCAMVQRDYGKALSHMQDALKVDPRHYGAYAARAVLKLYLQQTIDTKAELTNYWNPSLGRLLDFVHGAVLASKEEWSPALSQFMAAEDLAPGFSFVGIDVPTLQKGLPKSTVGSITLGVLLYLRNLPDQALAELGKADAAERPSFLSDYWAGVALLKKGDRVKALDRFERAVKDAPSFFSALCAAGELHFVGGRPAAAAVLYLRAAALRENPGICLRLGLFYEKSGDFDKSEQYYTKLIKLSPESFIGYSQLAWLYASQKKKLPEALAMARKADSLLPENANIQDTIGWIYYHQGDYARALDYLDKARIANPRNPSHWFHLGATYYALKKGEQARVALEQSLAISPDFDEAKEARKLLNQKP